MNIWNRIDISDIEDTPMEKDREYLDVNYEIASNKVYLFVTSALDLLSSTSGVMSPGIVKLHSIFTGNIDTIGDQYAKKCFYCYPAVYAEFYKTRVKTFLLDIFKILANSRYGKYGTNNEDLIMSIPITYDLRRLITKSFNSISENTIDTNALNIANLSLESYVRDDKYRSGKYYYTDIDIAFDRVYNCLKYRTLNIDESIILLRLLNNLVYGISHILQNELVAIQNDVANIENRHILFNSISSCTDETIIAAGIHNSYLLPYCVDEEVTAYSSKGKLYITNLFYISRNRQFLNRNKPKYYKGRSEYGSIQNAPRHNRYR
jgi:hypothetical protein